MASVADTRGRPEPRPWGAATAALVCTVLFTALHVLPLIGLIVGAVCAFPLVIQRLRGPVPAMITLGATVIFVTALFKDVGYAVAFVLLFAAPAWLIGEAMVRGRGLRRGCVWAFLFISAEIAITLLASGPDFVPQLVHSMDVSYSAMAGEMRSSLTAEQLEQLTEKSKEMTAALAVIYPAAFVIMAGLVVVMNGVVVRAYLARRDPAWLDGSELEGLRWPFGIAVAFVLSGLTVLMPRLRPLGYNALLVIAFLMALQGMAVVFYYAHRLAGPRLLRVGLLMLVLLNPLAVYILGLLGLFDQWFDFRRFADVTEPPK